MTGLAAGAAVIGFPHLLRARGVNEKLNVAHIGLGNMGSGRLSEMLGCGTNIVALCDVDENQFAAAKKKLAGLPEPKTYVDYRELLDKQTDLDAIVVTTPDHWHASIASAGLKAGKHVFCEKPLTHSVGETRDLRKLARRNPKLITQMGNQGSASAQMRRGIEVIQAGAIGNVREVHCWASGAGIHPGLAMPMVGDPVPDGLHWDAWLGPAPFRLYKKDYYHPWNWRGWFDFGNGVMADFGCHNLNLPFRALNLDYPTNISAEGEFLGLPTYPGQVKIRYDFAPRGDLPALTLFWYDGGRVPSPGILPATVTQHFGSVPDTGVLLIGDKGFTFGDAWKGADYIKLSDETALSGILNHAATRDIPQTLPRVKGHLQEWVDACAGGPGTFSSFEVGGHLTEIALAGVVALRMQQPLVWNGEKTRAENVSADEFIKPHYRKNWKI